MDNLQSCTTPDTQVNRSAIIHKNTGDFENRKSQEETQDT